jgi:hypothetical protein
LQQNLPKKAEMHVFAMPQLSQSQFTAIQRIHSLAHCSEINAMKKTHQILRMIGGTSAAFKMVASE